MFTRMHLHTHAHTHAHTYTLCRLQQDASREAGSREAEISRVVSSLREDLRRACEAEAALKMGLQEAQLQVGLV